MTLTATAFSLGLGATLAFALLRSPGRRLAYFPSLCWYALMVVPFALQADQWPADVGSIQSLGIVLVALVLLLTDHRAANRWQLPHRSSSPPPRRLVLISVGFIALLQLTHLAQMGQIPLLTYASNWFAPPSLSEKWEQWQQTLEANHRALLPLDQKIPATPESAPELRDWVASERAELARATTAPEKRAIEERYHQLRIGWAKRHRFELERTEAAALAQLREESSKLSGLPRPFIYLCQAGVFLTPALVLALWRLGFWYLSLPLCFFGLFYAQSTLSKGPILVSLFLYGILLWPRLTVQWRRPSFRLAVGIGFLGLCWGLFHITLHPLGLLRYRVPDQAQQAVTEEARRQLGDKPVPAFTLADHSRLMDDLVEPGQLSFLERKMNYLVYRVFLTPVEVSHRWYAYFPRASGGFLGLGSLLGHGDRPHPSNEVGVWAYQSRFPKRYLSSVHAYGSADADAYARGGVLALFMAVFFIGLLRAALGEWMSPLPLLRDLTITGTVLLGLFLPMASLQALIAAQGVGLIVAVVLTAEAVHRIKHSKTGQRFDRWQTA